MSLYKDLHGTTKFSCDEMHHRVSTKNKKSGFRRNLCSKRQLFILLFSILLISPDATIAQHKNANILLLLSDNKDVYLDVATTITNSTIKYCRNHSLSCQNSNYDISQVSSYDNLLDKDYDLIVTLGIHAAIFAKNKIHGIKIISALIPKNNPLVKEIAQTNSHQSFYYLDQPLGHSLALIKALSNRFQNIGIIINISDMITLESLSNSAKEYDLNLVAETVKSSENVGIGLNNLIDNIDIFLATPDTRIHNKSTVSNILLSNYRKRIPVIGFSSAYVKAGALAAVYSSPEDIAHMVRDGIISYFSGKKLPKEQQMSDYFSVLFNTDVARSLGFSIKSETKLKEQMTDLIHDDSE
jgi:ABC-type uncharacterized transport system substrate-binding protein